MRWMKGVVLFLVIFSQFSCSQNTVKEEISDSYNESNKQIEDKVVVNNEIEEKRTGSTSNSTSSDKLNLENLLEQVKERFKGVELVVNSKTGGKNIHIDVGIGETVDVADTSLNIEIEAYYPDFIMDELNGIVTKSLDEKNPSAKIKIYKEHNLIFDGWLFKNYPDVHPFDDDEYDIRLIGSKLRK